MKRLIKADSNFDDAILTRKLTFTDLDVKPDKVDCNINWKEGLGTIDIAMNNGDKIKMNYEETDRFNTLTINNDYNTNIPSSSDVPQEIRIVYFSYLKDREYNEKNKDID